MLYPILHHFWLWLQSLYIYIRPGPLMVVMLWQDPSDHNEPRIQEKLSLRRPSLPQRSLRHYLTREKVPSETNYRWVRVTRKT